ncbi:MAG TPA: cytochrome c biogenesis protein CcdA [Streptosporangiaceae bacterium]|nr:cytochrome c biogenesis protein CcdA [Streptosporangiaceae bacterium]
MSGLTSLVSSGPVLLAIPVAAAAGAVTFLSPCCLPLVPGYLSYVTGMSGTAVAEAGTPEPTAATEPAGTTQSASGTQPATLALADGGTAVAAATLTRAQPARAQARGRVVLGTLLFVLGFSVLFAIEGITVSSIGDALSAHSEGISRVLGAVIIVLGLIFMGVFDRFSLAGRIFRPSFRPRAGLAGAPLLGVMFGLSWTPCIGPTLAAVLTLSENSGTALRGGLLAFVYGLGIGIPFLIVAFAFQRGVTVFGWARRHARLITRIGGLMLIAVGLLEVTGAWTSAIIWLKLHWVGSYNSPI